MCTTIPPFFLSTVGLVFCLWAFEGLALHKSMLAVTFSWAGSSGVCFVCFLVLYIGCEHFSDPWEDIWCLRSPGDMLAFPLTKDKGSSHDQIWLVSHWFYDLVPLSCIDPACLLVGCGLTSHPLWGCFVSAHCPCSLQKVCLGNNCFPPHNHLYFPQIFVLFSIILCETFCHFYF